jgi:VanZ family protein
MRALAWCVGAGLLVLSLAPPSWRVVSGAPRALEHFAAFVLAGTLFAAAYPGRRVALLAVGVAVIAVVEVLQIVAPGRHAYVTDFVINAAGFAIAIGAVAAYDRLRR